MSLIRQGILSLCLALLFAPPVWAQSTSLLQENDIVKGARQNNPGVMERGWISGANPNSRDRNGNPAIIIGVEHSYVDVVKYLIFRGARVDERGAQERTALTIAASRGDVEIMTLLIEAGADIEKRGARQESPLLIAARYGHLRAVKLLIERGAYLEDTDLTGRTALDWARQARNQRMMSLLENAR